MANSHRPKWCLHLISRAYREPTQLIMSDDLRPTMESTIEKIHDAVVITLDFPVLNAATVRELRQDFEEVRPDGELILLDLQNVERVDSSGLGAVVALFKVVRSSGSEIKICNLQEMVRAIFELVRMHRLVDIFHTREEALS